MIFATKFLILGTLIFVDVAIIPAESYVGVTMLASKALEMATPLTSTAVQKLKTNIFGEDRAARSSEIVIFNKTDRKFKLKDHSCKSGGWAKSLLPERTIPPNAAVVYGAESHGLLKGYKKCRVFYESKNKGGNSVTFELVSSNPYFGKNKAKGWGDGVEVTTVSGTGMNNEIEYTIEENESK